MVTRDKPRGKMVSIFDWLCEEPRLVGKLLYCLLIASLVAFGYVIVLAPPLDLTLGEARDFFVITPLLQEFIRFLILALAIINVRSDFWITIITVLLALAFTFFQTRQDVLLALLQNLAFSFIFLKCGGMNHKYGKAFFSSFFTHSLTAVLYMSSGFIFYT